jgi:hypothetical protein
VTPFAEHLAAQLGANPFCGCVCGHGLHGAALGAATANNRRNDTAETMAIGEQLGQRVILVGTSTGARILDCATPVPDSRSGRGGG